MKIDVTLTVEQVRDAAHRAVEYNLNAIRHGYHGQHHESKVRENYWESHIVGAIGELAVCVAFGYRFKTELTVFKGHDVGPYQVRSTNHPEPTLKVRAKDDPNDTFILAQVGNLHQNRVRLHGWATGEYVRWHGARAFESGTYVMSRWDLLPLEELPEWGDVPWGDNVRVLNPENKQRGTG